MTVPTGYRRDVEGKLTQRQRDVLRLIARGKSNPEIADELGIGYESVKSHVSEVLGKLGVDRREEAAAWWRQERSLRRRVVRFGAGLIAFAPGGAGAVATGAALLLGGVVLTLVLLPGLRDGGTVAVVPATKTVAAPSPTAAGTPGHSVTPTPSGTPTNDGKLPPLRQVPGAVSKEMTLAKAYTIARGELWYFTYLCDACGPGPFPNLFRVYRASDGLLVIDDLKQRVTDLGLGNIVAFTANWQYGDAWIAACSDPLCGPTEGGGSMPGYESTVYRSRDGGITWKRDGSLPPETRFMAAVVGDEVLASTWPYGSTNERFWFYPSGRELRPPQGVTERVFPVVLNDLTIVWRSAEGGYYDGAGTKLFGPVFEEEWHISVAVADPQYQHTYITWSERDGPLSWLEERYYYYVARVDRDGQVRELYGLPGDTLWISGEFRRTGDKPPALFGRFRFGTSVDYTRDVSFGAVLDLETAQVHRFAELDAARPAGSFVWMQDLVQLALPEQGEAPSGWLRVVGAADCLNMREAPSTGARVITCLSDDVLVGDLGQRQTVDLIEWRLVRTPGQMVAWASGEFLR